MPSDSPIAIAEARRQLGLSPGADAEAVQRAFRKAVKAAHPDLVGGDGARLRLVIEAYQCLGGGTRAVPDAAPEAAPDLTREIRLEITPAQAMAGGWARTELDDGRSVQVRLPPGLRSGDRVRVSGEMLLVSIINAAAAAVAGNDVLVTVFVDRETMEGGGRLLVDTPIGETSVFVSRAETARGFSRLDGLGLPARGAHAAGDLILRLLAAPDRRFETEARLKRRRFGAAWAA